MPSILFIDNSAETFVSHRTPLVERLRRQGWRVAALLPAHDLAEDTYRFAFPVYGYPLARAGRDAMAELQSITSLMWHFARLRPDVVHLRTPKVWMYGGIAARFAQVPCVVSHITGLGGGFTSGNPAVRMAVDVCARASFGHPCQRIITQNRDDQLVLRGLGCGPGRLRLIRGSGVDASRFTVAGEPTSIPIVLLAARLIREKGIPEFVVAARLLRAQGVVARFVLVGRPDAAHAGNLTEADLQTWVAEGVVEWWGHRSDMPAVLAQATIVTLPSYYAEGLPKVVLEAMASGKPVVVADSPGCREPVADGVSGVLVPPRDSAALAAVIGSLLADRPARERLGRAARVAVEREFDLPVILEQTVRVFDDVVDAARRCGRLARVGAGKVGDGNPFSAA